MGVKPAQPQSKPWRHLTTAANPLRLPVYPASKRVYILVSSLWLEAQFFVYPPFTAADQLPVLSAQLISLEMHLSGAPFLHGNAKPSCFMYVKRTTDFCMSVGPIRGCWGSDLVRWRSNEQHVKTTTGNGSLVLSVSSGTISPLQPTKTKSLTPRLPINQLSTPSPWWLTQAAWSLCCLLIYSCSIHFLSQIQLMEINQKGHRIWTPEVRFTFNNSLAFRRSQFWLSSCETCWNLFSSFCFL